MASNRKRGKKKSQKQKEKEAEQSKIELEEHVSQAIMVVLFFVLAAFFTLAYFDLAGIAGEWARAGAVRLLGSGYFLLPLSMVILSVSFIKDTKLDLALTRTVGIILFFIVGLGIINIATDSQGGFIGMLISEPLVMLFDFYISYLLLMAAMVVSLVMLFELKISDLFAQTEEEEVEEEAEPLVSTPTAAPAPAQTGAEIEEGKEEKVQLGGLFGNKRGEKKEGELDVSMKQSVDISRLGTPFTPPPLSLLENDKGRPGVGDVKANANVIKRTLKNFGIEVEMDEVTIGPTVTRYALKPAEGVRLSRIESLQKDLSLALAARSIRVEAPIPGKSLVGIEIPNTSKSVVGLGSLLSQGEFKKSDKPLLVTLGRGISGAANFSDLSKMPHLLVAGATGSGKSVAVHMLIASLLYRNSPENLKFIMIDPKRVELTLYNDIPHLLTPVIKNAKKAILALKWAAKEMERRYDILESHRVQNIDSYHKSVLAPALKKAEKRKNKEGVEDELPESMPYIVIIIDELADIMTAYPKELEAGIVRLAQMSRAVGIHLILSTQRPSVNVITGLIKANIPGRMALQVSSQIDSRTILDSAGAEKLLGQGDMLFAGGEMAKPQRIQSGFISEGEVKGVVDWLIKHYSSELQDQIDLDSSQTENNTDSIFASVMDDEAGEEDDKYDEAKQTVVEAGKASTSYLQRKLGVGYSRAAKLVDMLEERGVIGPQNGSKPREVLAGREETAPVQGEAADDDSQDDSDL